MTQQKEKLDQIIQSIETLKHEMQSLRNEFHKIEDVILKDRLESVENALAQNRLLLYANQLEENMPTDFFRLMKYGCESQKKCGEMAEQAIAGNLELIKKSKIKEAFKDLDMRIENAKKFLEKSKKPECNLCYQNVLEKLKREKRTFHTIASMEKSWINKKSIKPDVSFLAESLEPIANKKRLSILFGLKNGKKSFTELSQITGLKGGHLIFHIKKLLKVKFIAQEGKKGDYFITQSGINALERIPTINAKV